MADAATGIPSQGEPFEFKKCLFVPQALGLRAATLDEFLRGVSIADHGSVYYHLHQPYISRVDVRPPYPGGYASWVGGVLGEPALAERLAALDPVVYSGRLDDLQREICRCISEHLEEGRGRERRAPHGREFAFCTTQLLLLEDLRVARDLAELRDGIADCGSMALFYHMFDTLERVRHGRDDFSVWVRHSLGSQGLAVEIERIDPYDFSIEETRAALLEVIDPRLTR